MDRVLSQIEPVRYNTEFQKELLDRFGTKKCKEIRLLSCLYSKPLRDFRKPKI